MEKYFNKIQPSKRQHEVTWTRESPSGTKKLKQESETKDGDDVGEDKEVFTSGHDKKSFEEEDGSNGLVTVPSECKDVNSSDKQLWYNSDVVIKHERQLLGLNVHYYPRFIKFSSKAFRCLEAELEGYFDSSPNMVKIFDKTHCIPRRQTAFGDSEISYSFYGVTISAKPWIPSIRRLKVAVEEATREVYNLVLVNYYRNGLDHIGEHRDDETEMCPLAPIASLSLGQERDFIFRHKDSRGRRKSSYKNVAPLKICLGNGSLLVMYPPTNTFWYHSLPVRKLVKNARINLTFMRMK